MIHVVNPQKKEWFHLDENHMIHTCPCANGPDRQVSICLSLTPALLKEGELRELDRSIAQRRKELGFLQAETLEEGYQRLLK